MLILCTGSINVEAVGERMRLSIPSGSDTLEIDLSLNQVLRLKEAARRAAFTALEDGFASTSATVVRFPKPRKSKRA
ncbi:MAG: hypothetical protein H2050_13625 [Sphingobium sp.]|uniref:hypothetical protein n=1 Tax=Sphingobium sp. TaxID=1912891 RepID=UPI0017EA653C|nr:hypothetical protein [Sphingobium sp.]MBA4755861.1 hypothetical protein [Sphingobium sp.]